MQQDRSRAPNFSKELPLPYFMFLPQFSEVTTISVEFHFIFSAHISYQHLLTYFLQGSPVEGAMGWQTEELLVRRSLGTV